MNFQDRLISVLLKEGKSTGGDMEATAERLGKWYKSIGVKAGPPNYPDTFSEKKPGEKGYMRKRNVPHHKDKYDPERHAKPKKGKPLEFNPASPHTAPDHIAATKVAISGKISRIASKSVGDTGDRPTQAQTDKYHRARIKGRDILRKYEKERERGQYSSF